MLGIMSDKLMEEIKKSIKELVESQKETDRMLKESHKKFEEEAKRRQEEAERRHEDSERGQREMKDGLNKLEELFTGQWGKLMEALVDGDLVELLKGKGVDIKTTLRNVKKKDGGEQWQVDILAINGEEVVVVEVKTTLKVKHVKRFVERTLGEFTDKICPEHKGKRVYGAVAYLQEDEYSASYAEKQGLYVIRATGGSASIINGEKFRPKKF